MEGAGKSDAAEVTDGSPERPAAAGGGGTGIHLVVPTRGAMGKSRLTPPPGVDHAALAIAVALDTVAAARTCATVASVTVVCGDPALAEVLASAGRESPGSGSGSSGSEPAQSGSPAAPLRVLRDPGVGLGAAIATGLAAAPGEQVAVLLGDLPALTAQDLADALAAARHAIASGPAPAAYVPDAAGTGTVLLVGARTTLRPAFGPGSAAAHARHATRLELDLPRLRCDVDDPRDLRVAIALGVGPRTTAALSPTVPTPRQTPIPTPTPRAPANVPTMQASVHTYDEATGAARLVTDDRRLLDVPAEAVAAGGLRHLRIGQRLEVTRDEAGTVTRVAVPGLEPHDRPSSPRT